MDFQIKRRKKAASLPFKEFEFDSPTIGDWMKALEPVGAMEAVNPLSFMMDGKISANMLKVMKRLIERIGYFDGHKFGSPECGVDEADLDRCPLNFFTQLYVSLLVEEDIQEQLSDLKSVQIEDSKEPAPISGTGNDGREIADSQGSKSPFHHQIPRTAPTQGEPTA